jgi:hypothetical protein
MNHFHTIQQDKEETLDERSVELFTFKGQEDYLDGDKYPMMDLPDLDEKGKEVDLFTLPDAYAIRVNTGSRVRYYVKKGKYGKLFNPIGLYSEGMQRKQLRHAGKPAWEFKETTEKVFTYYIKFLRSRNAAWLNNAEREV